VGPLVAALAAWLIASTPAPSSALTPMAKPTPTLAGATKAKPPTVKGKAAKAAPKKKPAVSGEVRFVGKPPEADPLTFDWSAECKPLMSEHFLQEVEVKDGKLRDVFVYVMSGLPKGAQYPVPTEALRIDNKSCRFSPKVFGMRAGQTVEMVNSDPILHNFHSFAEGAVWNVAVPKAGMRLKKTIDKPQVMGLIGCDIHGWMHSFIGVLEHPFFATSGVDGRFEIYDLPPGEYTLEFWHQIMGSKQVRVRVSANETAVATVSYLDTELPPKGTRPRLKPRFSPLGWE
jgi:hypothetical protein